MISPQLGTVAPPERTVLVVDDNVSNLKVISRLLQGEGCRVLTARDGKSGLEKALHGRPDLILLDVMMPKMDGFETCRHLKTSDTLKKIPVIFMTALTGIEDKIKAFELGGVDYVTKPFQPEEVLLRVRTHLRLHELTEKLEQVVDRRTRELQQEIDERKKAQEQLRKSENKFRTMMESFADPLYICSPDFRVDYMNPAMIKRIGRDVTGESCHSAIHGLEDKCEWCVREEFQQKGMAEYSIRSPLDQRNYRVTNMPIHNPDGSVSKMTIFKDITDFLSAVKEKEKAQALLAQSQKMESVGTLAGGIAHDFNNILAPILGYTEILMDDLSHSSKSMNDLMQIYTASNRAKDLVKQILTFARQSDEELRPMMVRPVVKEVIKFLRSSIPASISLETTINSDALILGNATQLHQVLINLCTNALQAIGSEQGTINVVLEDISIGQSLSVNEKEMSPGDYIKLVVSDNGGGMTPEIMSNIFEPYFTTKDPGEGTGLGLATTYGIVERGGGHITVDSNADQGSMFSIFWPAVQGVEEETTGVLSESFTRGQGKVLFVDDEEAIVKIGSRILEQLGYQVTSSTDSIEALNMVLDNPNYYDMIITDMTMPSMTGDRLIREIRKFNKTIPIILCTGYSSRVNIDACKDFGISACLSKPFSKKDISDLVFELMGNKKGNNVA